MLSHPENFVFSMKTFIYQMNFKMYIKYIQDIDNVINYDLYCKY